jgi:hypothetical protein
MLYVFDTSTTIVIQRFENENLRLSEGRLFWRETEDIC